MAHRSQVEGIESKAIQSKQSRTHARLRWSTRSRVLFDGAGSGRKDNRMAEMQVPEPNDDRRLSSRCFGQAESANVKGPWNLEAASEPLALCRRLMGQCGCFSM
jgi:hypothetical protein